MFPYFVAIATFARADPDIAHYKAFDEPVVVIIAADPGSISSVMP